MKPSETVCIRAWQHKGFRRSDSVKHRQRFSLQPATTARKSMDTTARKQSQSLTQTLPPAADPASPGARGNALSSSWLPRTSLASLRGSRLSIDSRTSDTATANAVTLLRGAFGASSSVSERRAPRARVGFGNRLSERVWRAVQPLASLLSLITTHSLRVGLRAERLFNVGGYTVTVIALAICSWDKPRRQYEVIAHRSSTHVAPATH